MQNILVRNEVPAVPADQTVNFNATVASAAPNVYSCQTHNGLSLCNFYAHNTTFVSYYVVNFCDSVVVFLFS